MKATFLLELEPESAKKNEAGKKQTGSTTLFMTCRVLNNWDPWIVYVFVNILHQF